MPRLSKNWSVSVKALLRINTNATVDMETDYPTGQTQSMTLAIYGECPVKSIRVRFGPFASDCETATVTFNGKTYTLTTEPSGDTRWA